MPQFVYNEYNVNVRCEGVVKFISIRPNGQGGQWIYLNPICCAILGSRGHVRAQSVTAEGFRIPTDPTPPAPLLGGSH